MDQPGEEVVVEGERSPATAAERRLNRQELLALPGRGAEEVLRAMPGVHLSAHGGRGKAFQVFLRGFDADHGSDLALRLGGVPLNEPSNLHGHGYLDLTFLPMVLLERAELRPGLHRVDAGDFALAGSAVFDLGLNPPGAQLALGGGTDRSAFASAAWRPPERTSANWLVAEADLGQGVGQGRSWRILRGGGGWQGHLGPLHARGFLLAGDAAFESPGVLREDDVLAGEVGFWDAYPGSGGGLTRRVLGSLAVEEAGERARGLVQVWGGAREQVLDQNFTGYYVRPVQGDGTRQQTRSLDLGLRGEAVGRAGGERWPLTGAATAEIRQGVVDQSELRLNPEGEARSPVLERLARPTDVSLAASVALAPQGWRFEPGYRLHWLALAEQTTSPGGPEPAGEVATGQRWVGLPKGSLTLAPDGPVSLLVAGGQGLRSAQAGGQVGTGGALPVQLGQGGEAGVRIDLGELGQLRGGVYGTWIDDELVFDPAAARFVPVGKSRRLGAEAGLELGGAQGLRWVTDLSWTEGTLVASGLPVPYAPRWLVVGGPMLVGAPLGPLRWTGSLRGVYLGPRVLADGYLSRPTGLADLSLRAERGAWWGDLDVDNVIGQRLVDGEYRYPSRWDPSEPRSELAATHWTAAAAPAARLTLGRIW